MSAIISILLYVGSLFILYIVIETSVKKVYTVQSSVKHLSKS